MNLGESGATQGDFDSGEHAGSSGASETDAADSSVDAAGTGAAAGMGASARSNLVPNDTNGLPDIFIASNPHLP